MFQQLLNLSSMCVFFSLWYLFIMSYSLIEKLEDSGFQNTSYVSVHKGKVCDMPCNEKHGILYIYEFSHLFCGSPKLHNMFFTKKREAVQTFPCF